MIATTRESIPVWIDCDPGHDDACAILMAAYHPSIDVLGISCVFGNTSLAQTTANTLSILELIGKSSIPVFSGASKPLSRAVANGEAFHGSSGIDGTELLPCAAVGAKGNAVEEMYKALMTTPEGSAWIIAIGPLTNIAELITRHPDVQDHIRGLSIMGGVIGNDFCAGSATATAPQDCWNPNVEFNILCDPEAAKIVLSGASRIANKTTLVPLDLTHRLRITTNVLTRIGYGAEGSTTLRQAFYEFLQFYHNASARITGLEDGAPLHDAIALAFVLSQAKDVADRIDFDYAPDERWQVDVSLDEDNAGRLQICRAEKGVIIPRDLDVAEFWSVFEDCMRAADQATGFNGSVK